MLPANEPRPGAQAELLRVLQKQHVEISRATAAFTVQVPARRPAAGGGRGGGGGAAADVARRAAGRGAADRLGAGGAAPSAEARDAGGAASAGRRESREFPAGSYIIRMDQPYSRIADALLDYQYWAPNDPQTNPYDDTGWTFPEGFGVQAVRVLDAKVLDVAVERGDRRRSRGAGRRARGRRPASSRSTTTPTTRSSRCAIASKTADIQMARGAVRGAPARSSTAARSSSATSRRRARSEATRNSASRCTRSPSAPTVKMHPARAARVALMHTWQSTQTEGWWRQAFDVNGVPYDYISVQDVAREANLRAKYDVILFAPGGGGGQGIIDGMPMWRNPMPWKNSPETPNLGTFAETDDIRPGLGWQGLMHLENFVNKGGVFIGAAVERVVRDSVRADARRHRRTRAGTGSRVVGSLLRTQVVDDTSPIVYGIADNLAVYSDAGGSFSVSIGAGGGRGGGGAAAAAVRAAAAAGPRGDGPRHAGRSGSAAGHAAAERAQRAASGAASASAVAVRGADRRAAAQSAQHHSAAIQRPRVALRFADQNELLVSGLLQGGGDIAQRPVVVDVPMERGHVVLFANNPIWRGETIGSYVMVFNAILNFDNLNAGRKLDAK